MTAKQKTAFALIQAVKNKLIGLKHGYIVNDELLALENLIKSMNKKGE